jgi:hypothetical protein
MISSLLDQRNKRSVARHKTRNARASQMKLLFGTISAILAKVRMLQLVSE